MKAIEIPPDELFDIHIKYAKTKGVDIATPVVHAGVNSPVINGKRIATGNLLSIFMPHTGGKARFSVMGQREHPDGDRTVYFGYLIQE